MYLGTVTNRKKKFLKGYIPRAQEEAIVQRVKTFCKRGILPYLHIYGMRDRLLMKTHFERLMTIL